jgi:hypothetical protein
MSQVKMEAVVVVVVELKLYTTQALQVMAHWDKDMAAAMASIYTEYGPVAVVVEAQVAQDLTPQFLEIKMVLATAVQGCCVT